MGIKSIIGKPPAEIPAGDLEFLVSTKVDTYSTINYGGLFDDDEGWISTMAWAMYWNAWWDYLNDGPLQHLKEELKYGSS